MSVRPLRKNELGAATSTLAAAFDDDPLFQYVLPTPARRRAMLEWFLRSALNECIALGGALTLEDGGPAKGVMALVPPGHWPVSLFRTMAAVAVPRAFPTMKLVTCGLRIEHEIRKRHPAGAHVYVYVLGVHPTEKGKGFGAMLMRHACALADANACVMHLETSNPTNLPFYRRFALEVGTELVSHGGPPVWTMTTPLTVPTRGRRAPTKDDRG